MKTESQFFKVIEDLTQPINGQYPRPWTTSMVDPLKAEGLIAGMNQATAITTDVISHSQFLDAHFGNGSTTYELYSMLRPSASETRMNIEALTGTLEKQVLETNVVCYSTKRAKHLSLPEHKGGKERGIEIFKAVLGFSQPKFVVVFGAKAQSTFQSALKRAMVKRAMISSEPECALVTFDVEKLHPGLEGHFQTKLIFIRSLGLPEWNKWKWDAPQVFEQVKKLIH